MGPAGSGRPIDLCGADGRCRIWYVLRSRPQKERLVRALLTRVGIEVFLPDVTLRYPHAKPASRDPLFPGYLFGSLAPGAGAFRLARHTYGIHSIVSYGTDPCPVPTELVATLHAMVERRRWASAEQLVSGSSLRSG